MNKSSLFTLLIVLFSVNVNSQWISFDKNTQNEPKKPEITLLGSDEINTVIKTELYGFNLKNTDVNGKSYQSLDLMGEASINEAGKPDLPLITKVIAVPNDASISVEVINVGEVKIYKDINMLPARKSWYEGDPETEYIEDEATYLSNSKYPDEQVSIDIPSVFRDFRIVRVAISPTQYVASKKELHVYSSVTVRVNYTKNGNAINPKIAADRPIAPSYDKLYRSFIFNYDEILNQRYAGKVLGHDLMLCIVPDILYDDLLPYADWKRKSGIDIVITKFSDIGATANNPTTIKDHITDAYMNWDVPPTHVLNVGDSNLFPIFIVNYDYSFANENYFVEVDGNDFFPEMMTGRLPSENTGILQIVVNKMLLYEMEPYIAEPEWFKMGLCASNNAYPSQVETKVFTSGVMQNDGGFTVDELMSTTPCTSTTQDVINGLNEGRSFLNYRGEGWYDGWWATCTQFGVGQLNALNSTRKNTFFTSIGCGVSHFYNYFSFGEQLFEMGNTTEPRGAIAFVGPGSNTHTDWNNHIDKGIYIGMFQEGMHTPGEGLARGLLYMYEAFGAADPWVEYHYRVYYVLGDPSIHIWKDIPRAINVDHVTSIPPGVNDIQVSVTHQDTNLPTENAQVTITDDNNNLFITGTTDTNGEVILSGDLLNDVTLAVTVRGPNVIPYQGTIAVGLGISDLESNLMQLSSKPNPFNTDSGVEITYSLNEKNNTSIRIYNVNGQLITELQNGTQNLGEYTIRWNGKNNMGTPVNSGLYYCQLISGQSVNTIKLLIKQ